MTLAVPMKSLLLAVKATVPGPFTTMLPEPEMALPTTARPSRAKPRVAPKSTSTAPVPRLPVRPPLPTCKVPPRMSVVPV